MIEIDSKVLTDLESGFTIPPKPELLQSLQTELNSDSPELNNIANIVAGDVAIAAMVLKVINSPYYGLARTITDIKQAVMFLGLEGITNLVTGFLLEKAFDQDKCCIRLERFWDTASEIAAISTLIGKKLKAKVPTENLHMVGLFHDAGIPAMAMNYANYVDVLEESNRNYHLSLVAREEAAYRTNHAVIGYFLATSWNLPKNICQLILRHHDDAYLDTPSFSQDQLTYATLKMAEDIVHVNRRFVHSPDWPDMQEKVLTVLDLDEEDYQDIKEDAEEFFHSLA
ncbi:HDOD domain-containing protein [Pseudoalteromonas spongiae]|uniref:HDOD domain-containing protein n=1 Tax=Pseudoalteromonas spongiae TaxID=298657 RepID=A0ABU8ESQ7_9GAMM